MKRYDLLTPEGTRDLLFDECVALRTVEDKLRSVFQSHGYAEVVTPGLEFFDVFSSKSRYFSQESMYKLTDAKGRLMVLRPDSTLPIARLVGTRLREETFPLKLFYNQTIYRANPK
ncbi:MAG: ATP phosphoribosyltransferase regulatory subunit, partial [Ruminiclostridium sp.]|nr:ATP phosphoribosyltransferase regulatory subunit [Ruminiclostridium sp.]